MQDAILIVEFARARQLEGTSAFDAAREAASVRLRPIVMTTFCFIHMVPPYFASGRRRDAPQRGHGHAVGRGPTARGRGRPAPHLLGQTRAPGIAGLPSI